MGDVASSPRLPEVGRQRRRWRVRVDFVPEDLWVGLYIKNEQVGRGRLRTFFVCIVPTLPIVVQWVTPKHSDEWVASGDAGGQPGSSTS